MQLVNILKVPFLGHDDLQILHLIPIPHRNSFLASTPFHELILTNTEKSLHIPIDFNTFERKILESIYIKKYKDLCIN